MYGYNWTGFHAGLNIGYSWGRSSSTLSFIDSTSGAILNANAVKFDMNGVIGGGQIGYHWQQSNWVFGLAQLAQLGAGFSYFRGFCIA
jgi:outer membrane immunogenic protein